MRPLLPLLATLLLAAHAAPGGAQAAATAATSPTPSPRLADDDRARLAEAFGLAAAMGDAVWPEWGSAPFALLLVTPAHEFLLRHPRPSADFTRVGHDSLLGSDVWVRARTLAPNLLATYPAVGGVPTIVVGTPAATGRSSTAWVLTVLHEHFHQLQTSRPGYYAGVEALGLARGDRTGMWMLNYAFPYDSAMVQARFAALAGALDTALAGRPLRADDPRWRAVVDARAALRAALPADDERYLAFQMWQEGVARYTELQVARWAAERHAPSAAFRALPDFTSYAAAATALLADLRRELREVPLARAQRVAFYPVGAATALLLDEVAPGWRTRYLAQGYALDAHAPRP